MPGQVRGLVAFRGSIARRGLNPRMYVPFPSIADGIADGFTPTNSYITAIQALGQAIVSFSALNDGAGNTASVSFIDFRPKALPSDYVFEFLTAAIARPRWATQRRSGAYGRPNVPPI